MARVLIVDDSVTIRLTIELILKREHETITAVIGQVALDILDQRAIDLIVTDIQMPVMIDSISLAQFSLYSAHHQKRIACISVFLKALLSV